MRRKFLTVFFLVAMAASLAASKVSDGGISDDGVEAAVSFLIDRDPIHPKKGDREWARAMAGAICSAAEQYEVNPLTLAAMAEFESHFRPDIIEGKTKGKAGETGMLQCGPDCARKCPHFMDTVEGQAMCGARWFRMAIDACEGRGGKRSDEWRGLAYYASGHYCDPPKDSKFTWKANRRERLKNRLVSRFGQ